jgi:hypothetical protein
VGGALAVGLGIGAAVWYAKRSAPSPQTVVQNQTTQPSSTPIDLPPAPPQFVELRFDSVPAGGAVFAEGLPAELCRTPCATKLDLRDGRSTERRAFLVRNPSFKDARIDVDLTANQREFSVTLERIVTVTETPPPVASPPPVEIETSGKPPRTRPHRPSQAGSKPVVKSDQLPTFQPGNVDVKKPAPGKKPEKIDPSDTLDPFRKK